MRYGLVLGQGRSGTNWMVDTLDASPKTFCRNEPNEASDAAMHRLPNHWLVGSHSEELEALWDEVAYETARRMGERDHRINHPKTYVYPWAQRIGLAQASARPKIRAVVSKARRSWAGGEWPMPRWVGPGPDSDLDTVAIFKLVQTYNWAAWVLEHRPDVPVVHVVRHPCGRHDSFLRRFIEDGDPEPTRRAKVAQLTELVAADPEWAERIGDPTNLDLAEAETWFGVYQSETIEAVGESNPNYLRIVYEHMVADPLAAAAAVFGLLGLELSHDIRVRIEADSQTSVFGSVATEASSQTDGWRGRLDADVAARIEAILATSEIAAWWS